MFLVINSDVHSFTNLLNAYVRCGDIPGAELVWMRMLNLSPPLSSDGGTATASKLGLGTIASAGILTPNVVTCTTLIKGYCEGSCMSKAQALFLRMLHQTSSNISDIITSASHTVAIIPDNSASNGDSKSKPNNKKAPDMHALVASA